MGSTSKSFALILILTIASSSLIIVGTAPFGLAQSGTPINSTEINLDTTWTKASSPYIITGMVAVKNGVTLTIEPGTIVNIPQSASLHIEGTLIARGTPSDNIVLNGGGELMLMANSTSWNNQTFAGCIIENADINYLTTTILSSPKISNNTVYSGFISLDGGSPQITSNSIACSTMINDSVQSPVISNNNIVGSIIIYGGAPIISQNIIRGISLDGQPTCSAIVLLGELDLANHLSHAVITDNTVLCGLDGISSLADGVIIKNNLVTNCSRNALSLGTPPQTALYATIENNTFANSTLGINIFNYNGAEQPPIIAQNNIQNNQANLYSYCTISMSIPNNWWGTTNEVTIKLGIHDHTFDSALGVINVMPCLTQANSFAYPNQNNQIPNPITTIPTNSNLTASTLPPPTPTPTASPISTPPKNETTRSINGTKLDLAISGNITSSQMTNVTIATNQTDNTTALSFNVTGESGTTGFANITIPINTIRCGTTPTIYIDGQPASNQGYTQESNNYYVWYTTHFSTHQISIIFTNVPNSTPSPPQDPSIPLEHASSQSSLIQIIYGLAAAAAIVTLVVVTLNLIIKNKKNKL